MSVNITPAPQILGQSHKKCKVSGSSFQASKQVRKGIYINLMCTLVPSQNISIFKKVCDTSVNFSLKIILSSQKDIHTHTYIYKTAASCKNLKEKIEENFPGAPLIPSQDCLPTFGH